MTAAAATLESAAGTNTKDNETGSGTPTLCTAAASLPPSPLGRRKWRTFCGAVEKISSIFISQFPLRWAGDKKLQHEAASEEN
jgi:hypothetical protein